MEASVAVLESAPGIKLHTWRRERTSASVQIVIVHGFGEHSGRYRELTETLWQRGFQISSFDQRGHGRSGGLAGHVDRCEDYDKDLRTVVEWALARGPEKLFLVGHSMGGLIALRQMARRPEGILGAAVSAPMLGFAVKVPRLKLALGRISGLIAPRFRMANEIDPAVLSRDPEVGREYAADPLVHRVVSARWFSEATRAMTEMIRDAPAIKAPVLIMHGTDERLTNIEATRRVFDLIGSTDKQLIVYREFYHELFNAPERHQVFEAVGTWLNQRRVGRLEG